MLLELDEVVCPHCRTPRDEREIEEGIERVQKEAELARKKPRAVKLAAAAAVLCAAVWLAGGRIAGFAAHAWNEFAAEVEKTRQPGHWRKSADPLSIAPAAPAAAAAKPEVTVSSYIYLATPSPAPAPAAPPPAEPLTPTPKVGVVILPPSQPPQSPNELRVQGEVYDLETALPVPNVVVRFTQNSSAWEATTDSTGRYQIGIFKNMPGQISVMIEAAGYRKGLLEDQDPPYRERSAASRAGRIAETADSDLDPVPLRFRPSAETVQLDLVLVPPARK